MLLECSPSMQKPRVQAAVANRPRIMVHTGKPSAWVVDAKGLYGRGEIVLHKETLSPKQSPPGLGVGSVSKALSIYTRGA